MVKRFVAYILFAVAAINILTIPIIIIGFRPLYERYTSAPPNVIDMVEMVVAISTLTIALIIFCVGIIVLIKSRKK
ncbi:MAG: hypothetical protein WBH31_15325 [Promethearchaeia archaeon]